MTIAEKQDLRRRFLAALRSGKYPQSRDGLRNKEGYCCLGVACDVYNPKGWEAVATLNFYRYKTRRQVELWCASQRCSRSLWVDRQRPGSSV